VGAPHLQKAGFTPESTQHFNPPLSKHAVSFAFFSFGFWLALNLEKPSHPLTICASVTFAIELITGFALRTPAALP